MRIETRPDGTIRILKDYYAWGGALVFIAGGAFFGWASIAERPAGRSSGPGLVFGAIVLVWGLSLLAKHWNEIRIDFAARRITDTSYGLLRRRRVGWTFDEVGSVGTTTFKDPRNDHVWCEEARLRMRNGYEIAIGKAANAEQIARLAGFPLEHKLELVNAPEETGSA